MKLDNFLKDSASIQKGAVKLPIKGMIEQYRERYNNLVKSGAKFRHQVYKTSPGGRTIVHVKCPSESVSNFFYDVLLELEYSDLTTRLEDCDVKIFSNCPSFVYTYAYVFYHYGSVEQSTKTKNAIERKKGATGMIINMLAKKIPADRLLVPGSEERLGDAVLDNAPVVRNPAGLPLLDKSLYHAIFYLQDNVPLRVIKSSKTYRTEAQIFASVADFDALMANRKHQEAREKQRKRDTRAAEENVVRTTEKTVRKANRIVKPLSPVAPHKSAAVRTATAPKVASSARRITGKH